MSRFYQNGDAVARVIQVIEVEDLRGAGSMDSVMRRVKRYFTLDGELLAENDPCPEATEKGADA